MLTRVSAALDGERLRLASEPDALEPDTILVLEIAGDVSNFARAMSKVSGLEFLGEQALEQLEPDADFHAVNQRGESVSYRRQLFLMASDAQAWREVLSLWRRFKNGEELPRGLTPFRDLFSQLRDVREWDDRDRLQQAGAADAWSKDFRDLEDQLVPFEAELWLRADKRRRAAVVDRLSRELASAGGALEREVVIEEIDYHGVLGRAPARKLLEAVASNQVSWLSTEGVRLFHAVGQMTGPVLDRGEQAERPVRRRDVPDGPARIVLLDGLPVSAHEALDGRLRVDDPDDWSASVEVESRNHGTLMASLVAHGDLGADGSSLRSPVHVRPILRPDPAAWFANPPETLPADELPVDLLHRAVAQLFEGRAPAAPTATVIVLAVGDPSQQFDRFISPLARLIDWLSWRYQVLFVVSAGNHPGDIVLPADTDTSDATELEHEVLAALQRQALGRRLLSPGESINALTVGAAHDDASGVQLTDGLLDPFRDTDLPNVVSPLASGINRAIKPDVLLPGGRQPLRHEPLSDGVGRRLSVVASRRPPGLRVAAPGLQGELNRYVHTTGTSCAAGVAGHAGGKLLERLDELREAYGASFPESGLDAVLVKAALAHTARWGSAAATIREVLRDGGYRGSRPEIALILGNGRARPEWALSADDHRAILLQAGRLAVDSRHTYEVPLPRCMAAAVVERRLTLTLAWLTPTVPRHRAYRAAALQLTYDAGRNAPFGERQEVANAAASRGTLQHELLMSTRAIPYGVGEVTRLHVECRATTGILDEEIPYALIATIDTPESLGLPIYEEIRQAIGVPAAVAVRPLG